MAKIKEIVDKNQYHFVYRISCVYDKISALNWTASLSQNKMLSIKCIAVNQRNSKSEHPYKTFSIEDFVEKYQNSDIQRIFIMANFHQEELLLMVNLPSNEIDLIFEQSAIIDYQALESCLRLHD